MTQPNPPAEREPVKPAAPSRWRRWRCVALAGALSLALCVAVPVGYLVWPVLVGTLNADKGQPSPNAALSAFVLTFNDAPNAIGVDRLIAPDRREQVGRQRREYMKAMAADRKATGGAIQFEAATGEPGDGTVVHGDRAAVVDSYRVVWMPSADERATSGGPPIWYNGTPHAWRADVRKDGDGWRVWSVVIPPWCGTYSRCGAAPAPTPSARPSLTPDDPLGGVKSMLPCGPKDPYPQLHDCPPRSPS